MNKEIQCPDCGGLKVPSSRTSILKGETIRYGYCATCKDSGTITDKEIQEAFEKWWNDDVMKTVMLLSILTIWIKAMPFLVINPERKK